MKIAITSTGKTVDSMVDPRFGRCSYFAVYNTETMHLEFVENTNKDASGGAGPATVQLIAQYGVSSIISGEFGGKVKPILQDLGIQMITEDNEQSTIQDILTKKI